MREDSLIFDVEGFIEGRFINVWCSPWQESRSREILEEKWFRVFSLELEKWIFVSRSPLDFQEFLEKFLFPLSFLEIFIWKFPFSSRLSRFLRRISLSLLDFRDSWEKIPFLFSIFKTLEKNFSFSSRLARFWSHISLSPLDYWPLSLSFQFPTGFRLHSNSVSHKNCRKENICLQMPKCAILALLGSPTLEM